MNCKIITNILCILTSIFSINIIAIEYRSDLTESWKIEENTKFNCTLSHKINNYGKVMFSQINGKTNKLNFSIDSYNKNIKQGDISIYKVQPPWVHGFADEKIGNSIIYPYFDLLFEKESYIIQNSLLEGKGVSFRYNKTNLNIYPISFSKQNEIFNICISNLYNFSIKDIEKTIISHKKNSTNIKHKHLTKIQNIISFLENKKQEVSIDINSYTDSYGGRSLNQNLSLKRANYIMKLFNNSNIKIKNITIKGHGEKRSIESNKTIIGRENNRRTIITII